MSILMQRCAYPIAIVQDRYGGTYSRGEWIALAAVADLQLGGGIVAKLAMNSRGDSPWGEDGDAMGFWSEPPDFVAVGNTPDEAVSALLQKGWWTDHGRAARTIDSMLADSDREGICPSEVAKRIGRSNWIHHLGQVLAGVGRSGTGDTELITDGGAVVTDFWRAEAINATPRGVELRIDGKDFLVRIRRVLPRTQP